MRHHQSQPALRLYSSLGKHSQLYIDEEINMLKDKKEHIIKLIRDQQDRRIKISSKQQEIADNNLHLSQLNTQSSKLASTLIKITKQIGQFSNRIKQNNNQMTKIRNQIIGNCWQLSKYYSDLNYRDEHDYRNVMKLSQKQIYMNILSLEEMINCRLGIIVGQNHNTFHHSQSSAIHSIYDDEKHLFNRILMKFCQLHYQLSSSSTKNNNNINDSFFMNDADQTFLWRRRRQQRIKNWQANWQSTISSSSNKHSEDRSFQQLSHIDHADRNIQKQLQLSRDIEDWLFSLESNQLSIHQHSTIMRFNNQNTSQAYIYQYHHKLHFYQLIVQHNLIEQFSQHITKEIAHITMNNSPHLLDEQQHTSNLHENVKKFVQNLSQLKIIYKQRKGVTQYNKIIDRNEKEYCLLLEGTLQLKINYNHLSKSNQEYFNKQYFLKSEISKLSKQEEQAQSQIMLLEQSVKKLQKQLEQSLKEQQQTNTKKASQQDIFQLQLAISHLSKRKIGTKVNNSIGENMQDFLRILNSEQSKRGDVVKNNDVIAKDNKGHECICQQFTRQQLSKLLLFKSQSLSSINNYNRQSSRLFKENVNDGNNDDNNNNSNNYVNPMFNKIVPFKPLNRTQSSLKLHSPKQSPFSQLSTNFQSPQQCKQSKSIQTIFNEPIKHLSKQKSPSQFTKSISSTLFKSTQPKISNFFKKFQTKKSNNLKLRLI